MPELDKPSFWIRTATPKSFPALAKDLTVDVGIVGGGITGITAAYLLKSAGLSVALIERERCAQADTGHTTAHLTMVTDQLLSDLVTHFGEDGARAVWDAGRMALDQIEATCTIERIDCDFRRVPGFLHQAIVGEGLSKSALREQATLARQLGFDASFIEEMPVIRGAGIRYENQGLFHPRKYLAALLATLPGDGCHVFESTTVDEVSSEPLALKCGEHTVTCKYIVLATHTPLMGKTNIASATLLQTKLALYSSYALGGRLPTGTIPYGLYWDTADPYHYLRVEPRGSFDYAIFGGADHKTGQVENERDCYVALEKTLRRLLPETDLTDRWSGQVIETNDGLPYIGETSDKQFAATGFAGNGMTFGTLSAMMARDAVLGRSNPWKELFSTSRTKVVGGTWDYVKENKDYLYYIVRDRFAAPTKSLRSLRPGTGKIVELDGQRVAAYRDERGVLTTRSALCTHMGCEVKWNAAETTWDCPCHGSRFHVDGSVHSGPAEAPLSEVDKEKVMKT
jgi:glycine/D-amino acid oxidase-like deaminating enzyme/nitrite reductase/ring-hydroxylating ferredoxin subunit